MEEPGMASRASDDAALVLRAVAGDDRAFADLVARHRATLVSVIRRYVADAGHAEDVMQETLLRAWSDIGALRDPASARAWLIEIARNRCRDHLKRAGSRLDPTDADVLDAHASRYGRGFVATREAARDAMNALGAVPAPAGDAARLFYDGFTIDEIAARYGRPAGTIKRYLHEARESVREALGVPAPARKERAMGQHREGAMHQPFPKHEPEVRIEPAAEKPFAVDFREHRWLFIAPEVGDRVRWAFYDPPETADANGGWRLTGAHDVRAVGRARVHGNECVEIHTDYWEPSGGWRPLLEIAFVRLTESSVEPLAWGHIVGGERLFLTHLDPEFAERAGGPVPRRIADAGRFERLPDGGYRLLPGDPGAIGAGAFDVTIGGRTFLCLRIIDVHALADDGLLMEGFVTREGRTVLCRRYNGTRWKMGRYEGPWDERLPNNARLVIDGATFVHWYDCLSDIAVGLADD